MTSIIDDKRSGCSSAVDPKLNPATAAVEKLKFFPDRKFKRVRLLSERDEDYNHGIDENELQYPACEEMDGAFDMTSLSQISNSISKRRRQPIITNTTRWGTAPPSNQSSTDNMKKFFSIMNAARDQDKITKKQRRLVRCIAWDSRLAQLDSSAKVHERSCSTISHFSPQIF